MGEEGGVSDFSVYHLDDAAEKRKICRSLLEALPEWFAIPAAREEYIEAAGHLPAWAAVVDQRAVGLALLKPQTPAAFELALIAVDRELHGKGVGRALVEAVSDHAKKTGARFLTVKTVDASFPNAEYDRTRAFYRTLEFESLEVFPDLWGGEIPCLMMVRSLR